MLPCGVQQSLHWDPWQNPMPRINRWQMFFDQTRIHPVELRVGLVNVESSDFIAVWWRGQHLQRKNMNLLVHFYALEGIESMDLCSILVDFVESWKECLASWPVWTLALLSTQAIVEAGALEILVPQLCTGSLTAMTLFLCHDSTSRILALARTGKYLDTHVKDFEDVFTKWHNSQKEHGTFMHNPLWEHYFRISLGTSAERREAASTISKLVEGNEEDWCQKQFGPKGKSLRCSHFYLNGCVNKGKWTDHATCALGRSAAWRDGCYHSTTARAEFDTPSKE